MQRLHPTRRFGVGIAASVVAAAVVLTPATASAAPAAPPTDPYVVNGGFESPSVPAGRLAGRPQVKGWQSTGQKVLLVNGTYGPAEEGSQYVLLTAGKSTGLSQTARLDKTYDRHIIEFWYAAQPGSSAESALTVTINGVPATTITDNSWGDEPGFLLWNIGEAFIPRTPDRTVTVTFQNAGPAGGPGMLLDDVFIYPIENG